MEARTPSATSPATASTAPGRIRRLLRRLRGGLVTRRRAALSVAAGLFIGTLPLYGLHLPLVLLVCLPLRLDAVTAYLAANISNPLVAPFLVFAEVEVGALLLSGHWAGFDLERARRLAVADVTAFLAVGSGVLATVLATVGGAIAHRVAPRGERRAELLESAIPRVVRRYAAAHRRDRIYVRIKLNTDPATSILAGIEQADVVLDAGCGRGQFGLLLRELGSARLLSGLDWDERRINAARSAARAQESFAVRSLLGAPWPDADLVLVLDVLHYLPVDEQDAALEHAIRATRPGGRILIRLLETRHWLTRALEALAVRLGLYRARGVVPRRLEDLAGGLRARDFAVQFMDSPALWGSRFLLATRSQSAPEGSAAD